MLMPTCTAEIKLLSFRAKALWKRAGDGYILTQEIYKKLSNKHNTKQLKLTLRTSPYF